MSPEQAETAANMVNEFGGSATPEDVMQFAENMEMQHGEEQHAPEGEYHNDGDMHMDGNMPPPPEGNADFGPGDIDPGNMAAADAFGISPEQAKEIGDTVGDIGPDGMSTEQAETAANMVNEFGGTATPEDVMQFAENMDMQHDGEHHAPEGEHHVEGDIDPGNMAAADAFGISPEQAKEIGDAVGDVGPDGMSTEQAETAANMVNEFGGTATPEDVMQFAENMDMQHDGEHHAPEGEHHAEGDMPPPAGEYHAEGDMPPPVGEYAQEGDMPPPPAGEYHAESDMPPPPAGEFAQEGDMPPPADSGWNEAPQAESPDLGIALTDSAAKDPAEATDPFAGTAEMHNDAPAEPMMDSAADELASGVEHPQDPMQDPNMTDAGPDTMGEPPMDDQSGLV